MSLGPVCVFSLGSDGGDWWDGRREGGLRKRDGGMGSFVGWDVGLGGGWEGEGERNGNGEVRKCGSL